MVTPCPLLTYGASWCIMARSLAQDMANSVTAESASTRYASLHAAALQLLLEIETELHDKPAPSSRTNWGHVGSMGHTVEKLEEIKNQLTSW